jgi:ElaB/YqjD/DUF883 family membrane-anchored ribosome-binding protein
MAETKGRARRKAAQMKVTDIPRYVEGVRKDATAKATQSVKKTKRVIRERPLTAVGAAVAGGTIAGLVAGAIIARRKSEEPETDVEKDESMME